MGVSRLYRVGSPYNGVELNEIDFEQSADTMYLAHIDHVPTKLQRFGHTNWQFVDVQFSPTLAVPADVVATAYQPVTDDAYLIIHTYVVTALDDDTGQESRVSTSTNCSNDLTLKGNYNTVAWSAVTGAERYRIYKAENQQAYGYVGTTDGLDFTDANILPDQTDGPPVADDPFVGVGNYPSTVTFFEQRLIWGRSKNRPNAVWGSKSGDYENMDISRPLKDDDALSFQLVAGRVNAVNQLVSLTDLFALSSDSIFKVNGGGNSDYLSPTQIVSRRQIGRGSSRLGPLVVDNVIFYKPSVGSSVRSLNYSFELDGIKSDDVSIFSPHLFRGYDIVSWAYAQEPRSIIYAVRDDGRMLAFSWEQDQQIQGWSYIETDGFVESVCVISEGGEDRVYLTVRRISNEVERTYIERMASADWDGVENSCFLDCAVSFAFDAPTDTLTNLFHLEGRTCKALADGNVVSDLLVVGGRVLLPYKASVVTIGLPYDTLVETLPLAIQTGDGWNIGKRQQARAAVLRLVDTRGISTGPSDDKLYELKPRSDEAYGEPNALRNGDYEVTLAPDITGETVLLIASDEPLPMTVTAILLDPVVSSR